MLDIIFSLHDFANMFDGICNVSFFTKKQNTFNVQLKYVETDGKVKTLSFGSKINNWADSCFNRLDTMTFIPQGTEVQSYFRFPTNEYDLTNGEIGQTKLIITSSLAASNKTGDRTFRIDCIILEPIDEDTFVDPLKEEGGEEGGEDGE